jgi:hypothetical protein
LASRIGHCDISLPEAGALRVCLLACLDQAPASYTSLFLRTVQQSAAHGVSHGLEEAV